MSNNKPLPIDEQLIKLEGTRELSLEKKHETLRTMFTEETGEPYMIETGSFYTVNLKYYNWLEYHMVTDGLPW